MSENKNSEYKLGLTAGLIGIISNVVLFGAKIAVGLIANSITIVADAINNLTDAAGSVVTVVGFKLSSRPADSEHPFGHERIEQIAALLVAIIVFAVGALLAKTSIEKILDPQDITVSTATYVVLALGITAKVAQMLVYRYYGKKIDSDSLRASSQDSRNDAISTTAVLISTIVIATTGVNIDGYMGLAVSIFIIVSSIMLLNEVISPLLGEKADKDFVKNVGKKLLSYEGVLGIHDLMVHLYGKRPFVTVHVEVDSNGNLIQSHDIIDNIERDFMADGIHLSIHMDPIVTDNSEVTAHRERVKDVIKTLDSTLSIHDFRMVFGDTHINVLFDVVIPYASKTTLQNVKEALEKDYNNEQIKYYFVISVDRDFV